MKKPLKALWIVIFSIVVLLIIAFVVTVTATYRYYYYQENRPDGQRNTTWCSEDGNITIYIGDYGDQKVIFEQDGVVTECYFTGTWGRTAEIYDWEAGQKDILTNEALREKWKYQKVREDSFTITVEQATFLKVGDEITFYKMQ